MMYVDVILPLPLEGLFTYAVPDTMQSMVCQGVRVQVQLGKSKTYTAMVAEVHQRQPQFKTRAIMQVLDTEPILLPQQFKLWQWVADYYMSPIGDVFKAALPPGLKVEDGYRPRTETYVTLPQNFRNEQALHIALSMLRRAEKQLRTFACYLALSHWDTLNGQQPQEPVVEITREELMNEAHCTTAVLKALTDRHLLVWNKAALPKSH